MSTQKRGKTYYPKVGRDNCIRIQTVLMVRLL
jgi:hypothetical protein